MQKLKKLLKAFDIDSPMNELLCELIINSKQIKVNKRKNKIYDKTHSLVVIDDLREEYWQVSKAS